MFPLTRKGESFSGVIDPALDELFSFEGIVWMKTALCNVFCVELMTNLCSEFKLAFVSNVTDRGLFPLLFGKLSLPEELFPSFSVRLQSSLLKKKLNHFLQTARVSLLKNNRKKFNRQ